jgi:hypothetical protein
MIPTIVHDVDGFLHLATIRGSIPTLFFDLGLFVLGVYQGLDEDSHHDQVVIPPAVESETADWTDLPTPSQTPGW